MKRILSLVVFVFVSLFFLNPAFGVEPYQDSRYRNMQKALDWWFYPKTVTATGVTSWIVDVSSGGLQLLDTANAVGGTTIFFTGQASIPTRTFVCFQGNAKHVGIGTASPVVWTNGNAGTYPPWGTTVTNANYTYILEVLSGLGDTGGGMSGTSVYIISGVTCYK